MQLHKQQQHLEFKIFRPIQTLLSIGQHINITLLHVNVVLFLVSNVFLDVLTRRFVFWDELTCSTVFWDVLACNTVFCDVLACSTVFWDEMTGNTVFWDVLACTIVFCDVLACITVFWDELTCSTVSWNILACNTVFWDELTCSTVFWDVLTCSTTGHRNGVVRLPYGRFHLIRIVNLGLGEQFGAKMLIGGQRKQTYSFRMSADSHSI